MLNIGYTLIKIRLKEINIIRLPRLGTKKKDFQNRKLLIDKFLKKEISYEQLIKFRKQYLNTK